MDTATDGVQHSEERYLLDRPQRFGILPTWWFWRDRKNWRMVGWGFGIIAAVTNVILAIVQPHPLIGGLVAGLVIILANGLLEKYVRRQAVKRRALEEAKGLKAMGP
jgi:hypothetical protein